jgi:enoyl-CoA hydratase/carnithine racemase
MSNASTAFVLQEQPQTGVVRLVMNRPDSFNALSSEMLSALEEALVQASESPDCRVIVLAALGKAYCAGHDLREMRSQPDHDFYTQLFAQCSRMMMRIQQLPQPVIAQVQGIATAAGCQLVAMCDLAVAADTAKFAVSGINYGLFCATPSVGLSRSMHRKQAMEMLLTGDFIDAHTAVERGLINQAVAADDLAQTVLALCAKISAKPETAVRLGKGLFYQQLEMGVQAAYQLAGQTMACNMMHDSAQEGFQAFIEKRKPTWTA